jgi:anti-sigma B factor antagonist
MKIETRTIGEVKIIDCTGKIKLGEGTINIRNAVRDSLQRGSRKIVINLSNVDYIDSSGVGELVSAYTSAANSGAQLALLGLTKKIREMLAITKLLTVFETFEYEEAALARLR